ncbi:MAG TPA: exodeoxyribonuclease VII large subunit [Chloroflexi bacterium]|nr:exodeoxyribonuclease VII large subunit [Chloroflexota bacterium]
MFEQLSLFSEPAAVYTVSQLVASIRAVVEADPLLADVWVEGELSNFRRAASGHCYFTLKDAEAELRCVMWRSVAEALRAFPADGDQVLVHGHVGVYEQRGSLQLYVDDLKAAGVGLLYQEFERLKARLEAEGLFAPERKRPLPRFPRRIGVVTSPAAAALRDILHVLARRYPLAEVLLSPTLVQGEEAPPQIAAALEALNRRDDVDVILVARGGGSLEELWAFNDERVARAVAGSRIPVVCGVGHETDFTLADFAADRRAPTPSAAAEIATPDRAGLHGQVMALTARLTAALETRLAQRRTSLTEQVRALRHLSPAVQLAQVRQRVDDLAARAADALQHTLSLQRERLAGLAGRLEGVSPLATLERGYAVVHRRADGQVVRSVAQVGQGDDLNVRVSDGEFEAVVSGESASRTRRRRT